MADWLLRNSGRRVFCTRFSIWKECWFAQECWFACSSPWNAAGPSCGSRWLWGFEWGHLNPKPNPKPTPKPLKYWSLNPRPAISANMMLTLLWVTVTFEDLHQACSSVAVCCSVLWCVAVCSSVLQCVAVCCSVLQCVAVCYSEWGLFKCCNVLQCVAVCGCECGLSEYGMSHTAAHTRCNTHNSTATPHIATHTSAHWAP